MTVTLNPLSFSLPKCDSVTPWPFLDLGTHAGLSAIQLLFLVA